MQIVAGDPPPEMLVGFLEHRREVGADLFDEVWDGVVHLSPDAGLAHSNIQAQLAEILGPLGRARGLCPSMTFNLGPGKRNYRVPDAGLHRGRSGARWLLTAALAIEIVSPGDASWQKFDHFAFHGVDEVAIVDPYKRTVDWFGLADGRYEPVERSGLIELSSAELAARIDWPPVEDA